MGLLEIMRGHYWGTLEHYSRKGHVPLMCSLILHMTHQHHLLCHDYEPTFILHLPPCVLHKTGGLVFQIKADVDGVLSCQRPSVVWLRY